MLSMEAAKVTVAVTADTSGYYQNMQGVENKLQAFGKTALTAGKSLTKSVTLPIAAAGIAAFEMGKDFESSMSLIVGLVGESTEAVETFKGQVLELAGSTAKAPIELADALYFITSAGIKGAAALDVLEMSAKASASGLGEVYVIADLVTSVINAYGAENITAAAATDILVAAVREGKADATEFAGALGQVLPIAAEMGVEFHEVAAATAAMTRTGTDAGTANMQLKNIMMGLLRPVKQAEDALNGMGTSSKELREQIREKGLMDALLTIRELTHEFGEDIMATVFPNIRSLIGVLDLMGANLEDNVAIFDELSDATGALDHAFETVSQTAEFKMNQALSNVKIAFISLWEILKDVIVPAIENLAGAIESATKWFTGLDDNVQQFILGSLGVAAAIGPILILVGHMALGFNALWKMGALLKVGTTKLAASKFGLAKASAASAVAVKAETAAVVTNTIAKKTAVGGTAALNSALGFTSKTAVLATAGIGKTSVAIAALKAGLVTMLPIIGAVVLAAGALGYIFYNEWKSAKDHSERGAKFVAEQMEIVRDSYMDGYHGMSTAQAQSHLDQIDAEIKYFGELESLTEEQTERLKELHQERHDAIALVTRASRFDMLMEETMFGIELQNATKKNHAGVIDSFDNYRIAYMDVVREKHYDEKMEQIRHLYESGKINQEQAADMIKNVENTWEKGIIPATNASMARWILDQGVSLEALGLVYDQAIGEIVPITEKHLSDWFHYMNSTGQIISFDAWSMLGAKGADGLLSQEGNIFYSADMLAKAALKGIDVDTHSVGVKWGRDLDRGLRSQLATMIATARMMSAQVRSAFGDINYSPTNYPRYHTGGTFNAPRLGGEGLALLKDRERVLPPGVDPSTAHLAQDSNEPQQNITYEVNIGTLIADDHGLTQLERRLKDVRLREEKRMVTTQ